MSFGIVDSTIKFETLKEIGQEGQNSQVFLAHDKQFDAQIVAKRIEKSKFSHEREYFQEAAKLYQAEHPYVVKPYYASQDSSYIWLVMRYYKNGSLSKKMNSKPLTVKEVIRYSLHFLTGLNNIHYKKLLHFDIKPNNILIADNDEALLSDFGLAKHMDVWGLSSASLVYTLHTPPEYFSQTQHSMLFDIYQAGVTLYRMCNGEKHYSDQLNKFKDADDLKAAIVKGKFPDRNSFLPHIPSSLRRCIKKAMHVNQHQRFETALDLLNQLNAITEFLDWEYAPSTDGGDWKRRDYNKTIEINVKFTSSSYTITTYKTMASSLRRTRVSAGCINNVPENELEKRLQELFTEHEK